MITFLLSFLLTSAVIIYLNLPAVMARPIDIVPRLIFYFAFPASVFVGMAAIGLAAGLAGLLNPVADSSSLEPAIV